MTSLNEYAKSINKLARKKGWSDDPTWLKLGAFKELGELVQAMERLEASKGDWDPLLAADAQKLRAMRQEIGAEFADVMHYLLQAVKPYRLDLDKALEDKIKDNYGHKKKTLDKKGRIVRR